LQIQFCGGTDSTVLLQLEPSFAEQHTEKPNGAMVSLGLTFK
jgi:predicted phosphoadenosine phosphosulfate sulfurtransferase